jgi:hypothetical protein
MRTLIVFAALAAGCSTAPREETPATPSEPPLTLQDISNLHASGLGPRVLIARIETSRVSGVVTTQDLLALQKQGVPDEVLAAIVYATHQPPPPTVRHVILHRYEPFDSYWHYRRRWWF